MRNADHRTLTDHRRTRFLLACGGLAGVATVALGLVVIVGWYLGNRTLIQVLPQFVPMHSGKFEQSVLYRYGPAQVGFSVLSSSFHRISVC